MTNLDWHFAHPKTVEALLEHREHRATCEIVNTRELAFDLAERLIAVERKLKNQ